jgi:hypothetical protein
MKKNMKQILATSIFAGALFFGTSAYAEGETTNVNDTAETTDTTVEEESEVSAGVTPDSFFYLFDKVGENLQLLFTSDLQKESELLLQFANERLSESNQMVDEEKDKYINQLIGDYLAALQKAQEKVAEVVIDENIDGQVKEELSTKLEDTTTVTNVVTEKLEEDQKVQLDEKRQEAYLVANIVEDLDPEKVKKLRDQGLGFGEIVKVVALAEESGKTEEEIISLFQDGKGYGDVAKELNIEPSQIMKKVIKKKEKYIEEMMEKAKESGNEEAVQKLSKSIEDIKRKKVDFKILEEHAEIAEEVKGTLSKIQGKLAAGDITQEKADRKINKLKKESKEELDELKQEAEEEVKEIEEEMEEEFREAKEEAEEDAREKEEEERETQKELEEERKERAKEAEEEAREKEEEERERQKELEKERKERAKEAKEQAREKEAENDDDDEENDKDEEDED